MSSLAGASIDPNQFVPQQFVSPDGSSTLSTTSTASVQDQEDAQLSAALSHISVPFLAINIIGSGLVLFVGNLWSQVFAQWMNQVEQSPIFDLENSTGDIIQTTATVSPKQDPHKLRKGFWLALVATFVAIFGIWLLLKFYQTSHKEFVRIKRVVFN